MNIQFLLSFNKGKGDFARSKIRIFYSLRKRRASREIISSFIDELRVSFPAFEWEISGFFAFLFNLKYLGIYVSSLPAMFMEISNLKPEEQKVLQKLIDKVLIMTKEGPVPLKNNVAKTAKAQPSSAKTGKKQKRKANSLSMPPEGPVFQFVPPAKGETVYPFLPPHDQEETLNILRQDTP